ncbi:MAG: hypothetical protein J6M53_03060 [Bacteroidaceae bacterium]|nr:hypothetical protein [Bacteroidaceae bacterium]
MKKTSLLIMAICALLAVACQPKKGSDQTDATIDSLRQALAQSKSESSDLMGTIDQIQEGFRKISEAEGEVVELNTEGGTSREDIVKKMTALQERLQQNRELINSLQEQLRSSSQLNDNTRRTFENMIAQFEQQLAEKQQTIETLQRTIEQREATIASQAGQISDLNTSVQQQQSQINDLQESTERQSQQIQQQQTAIAEGQRTAAEQSQRIAQQEAEMNTAYYVFGTKSELKKQGILQRGDVLRSSSYNRDYFTKIDIRVTKLIKLYSKRAELLTNHPAGSYVLERDAQKQYSLRITDPQAFWRTSKHLVIEVK